MRLRLIVAAALAVAVVPALAAGSISLMSPVVSAKLLGKNEVPKGSPTGSGIVTIHLNSSKGTVCWAFTKVRGIGTPQVSHIHKGKAGVSGPVFIPLGGAYKTKGCTKASKSSIEAVEKHPNSYYVNIHTKKYPEGAIRGQLVAGMMEG